MKSVLFFALTMLFSANTFGQTISSEKILSNHQSSSLINEVSSLSLLNIFRLNSLQTLNTGVTNGVVTAFPSFKPTTEVNNAYIQPLQLVNNLGIWCAQESLNSQYFVDKIDYKSMNVGNLKMNAFYIFDNMGNLRSTSTSFSKD